MNPIYRSTRMMLLVGLVAGGLAACSDSTEPTGAAPRTLTLTAVGLPGGAKADFVITGPHGYSSTQAVGASPVTLTDLGAGTYTIAPASKTVNSADYVPIPASQTAEITFYGSASVTAYYGAFILGPSMRGEDISADGSTVLLTDVASATADFYFYNVATGANSLKAAAGDAMFDFATGISNDLRVSAIHGKPEQAGLWQQATGWLDLGNIYPTGCLSNDIYEDQSGGWDIDSAGHTAVGLVWNGCNAEAFLWTDAGGPANFVALDLLGDPSPENGAPPINRATVISDDGQTAAGFASHVADVGGNLYWIDRWPAIWHANGSGFLLPSNPVFTDDCPGEVLAIAGNGSLVTGVWCDHAFLWSEATGVVDLTPGESGHGQAVARNGELVFGTVGGGFFGGPPQPFVWTEAGGVQYLLDIALANGISLPNNSYWEAVVAASADGTVVVGTVYDEAFQLHTYVLKLPVSAYGL